MGDSTSSQTESIFISVSDVSTKGVKEGVPYTSPQTEFTRGPSLLLRQQYLLPKIE